MGSIGEHFLRMQDNDLDFFVAFFFFLHCCVMTDWLQVLLLTVAKIVVFQTMMTIFQNQGVPKQGNNALRHSVVIAIRALTGHFGSVDTVSVEQFCNRVRKPVVATNMCKTCSFTVDVLRRLGWVEHLSSITGHWSVFTMHVVSLN